jgi:ERCC4-related helicase
MPNITTVKTKNTLSMVCLLLDCAHISVQNIAYLRLTYNAKSDYDIGRRQIRKSHLTASPSSRVARVCG